MPHSFHTFRFVALHCTYNANTYRLATATRTLATSTFKRLYDHLRHATIRPDELLRSVHDLIREHAQRHGIADTDAEAYFTEVQSNALQASAVGHAGPAAINEFLHNCQLIAVRMYTTTVALAGGKELCGILNEAVRA